MLGLAVLLLQWYVVIVIVLSVVYLTPGHCSHEVVAYLSICDHIGHLGNMKKKAWSLTSLTLSHKTSFVNDLLTDSVPMYCTLKIQNITA